MKSKRNKIILFSSLLLGMVYYIGWVFYKSEPKYIDNCYKKLERYDYVSIPRYDFDYKDRQVNNGIVLQVDDSSALVKINDWRGDDYYQLTINKSRYRIIGKGTIYHKINNYVGFNIMMISLAFTIILIMILAVTLVSLLKEFI